MTAPHRMVRRKRKAVAKTPGPWRLFKASRGKTLCINGPTGELGRTVDCVVNWPGFDSCDKPWDEQVANAEHIVRACNAYPRLVEALRDFVAAVGPMTNSTRASLDAFGEANDLLRELNEL